MSLDKISHENPLSGSLDFANLKDSINKVVLYHRQTNGVFRCRKNVHQESNVFTPNSKTLGVLTLNILSRKVVDIRHTHCP